MTQAIMPCGLWNVGEPQPRVPSRTAGLRDEAGGAFDDKYILQQKLGDGMTACVYVATERAGGRQCACKLSERRLQRTNWTRIVQVLRHEYELLHGLGDHPNIVRWENLYLSCNQVGLVLELVPGGDCQQLLQRHGCLSEPAVHAMISQLRSALAYVHGRDVLHRDVKLENLLVNTDVWPPVLKLCDFGHASAVADAQGEIEFYGTPGYAAPEVLRGPVWAFAADVWALGVVMFALLANSLPFERERSWLRPPDFSGRAWWQVSIDAKLLLQVRPSPLASSALLPRPASPLFAPRPRTPHTAPPSHTPFSTHPHRASSRSMRPSAPPFPPSAPRHG